MCSLCAFLAYNKMNLTVFVILNKFWKCIISEHHNSRAYVYCLHFCFLSGWHVMEINFVKWTTVVAILWQWDSSEKQAYFKGNFFFFFWTSDNNFFYFFNFFKGIFFQNFISNLKSDDPKNLNSSRFLFYWSKSLWSE